MKELLEIFVKNHKTELETVEKCLKESLEHFHPSLNILETEKLFEKSFMSLPYYKQMYLKNVHEKEFRLVSLFFEDKNMAFTLTYDLKNEYVFNLSTARIRNNRTGFSYVLHNYDVCFIIENYHNDILKIAKQLDEPNRVRYQNKTFRASTMVDNSNLVNAINNHVVKFGQQYTNDFLECLFFNKAINPEKLHLFELEHDIKIDAFLLLETFKLDINRAFFNITGKKCSPQSTHIP